MHFAMWLIFGLVAFFIFQSLDFFFTERKSPTLSHISTSLMSRRICSWNSRKPRASGSDTDELSDSQHASHAPVDQWYHMTASSRVCSMCSEHEEQRRLCSPESWVSHQCQLARWCARFTTCGLGCEGACGMWSLRHFVALYARILILRTEHVRCRGGQQHR